ncbi:MAG: serine hydrolase, partial [Catalinimonas sp.]
GTPALVERVRRDLAYEGLILTDARRRAGDDRRFRNSGNTVAALGAGNDVVLFAPDVPGAVAEIEKAVHKRRLDQADLDQRVRRVLGTKYRAGLHTDPPAPPNDLATDLYRRADARLSSELYAGAITVARNERGLLPFFLLDTTTFASVAITPGVSVATAEVDDPGKLLPFQQMLNRYAPVRHYRVGSNGHDDAYRRLRGASTVLVALYPAAGRPLDDEATKFIRRLYRRHDNVVLVLFGSPHFLGGLAEAPQIVCAYEDAAAAQKLVPQILFGGRGATGTLPLAAASSLGAGTGFLTPTLDRLSYTDFPELVGMDPDVLARIDDIARQAIADRATPGCQIMVAKGGTVVWDGNYGHQTYARRQPITSETIYDIASVSKVAGTLQAVMMLHEQGLIDINQKASHYLPELRSTNKRNLVIADILSHQAGLIPYIPHYKQTISPEVSSTYYAPAPDSLYNLMVIPGLYARRDMEEVVWRWTVESGMLPRDRRTQRYHYKYSDIGFYIMKRIVERVSDMPLDEFVDSYFYRPLGLPTLTYRPLEKFSAERIAPTEKDDYFRNALIRGTVHD